MAGIGFELKNLFTGRGALATLRAYGYTAAVCAGPMLLGALLLLGIRFLSIAFGTVRQAQDLLVAMITYSIVGSLVLSNTLSMLTTRFVADMLYEEKPQFVLPSLYGSLALLLAAGGVGYDIFLRFSGISSWLQALNLVLFLELVTVWTQMSYMTAVKGYRSILATFAAGVAAALLYGYAALKWLRIDTVTALMSAVILGYGLIAAGFFLLLHRRFPQGEGSAWKFLAWFDRCPHLAFIGLFLTAGLFVHLVITWFGPAGIRAGGLFFEAPSYDIPAFAAFLLLVVSTVNFTVSAEVNFYPLYREYIDLFNGGGALSDIQLAEDEMLLVLRQEIGYLAYRQFVAAVLFIIVGTPLIAGGNLGFTETMLGTFRILCIGYGLYGIANSVVLLQLYFADNAGAFWSSLAFAASSTVGTLVLLNAEQVYCGFGFLAACAVLYVAAWIRLWRYTSKLQHRTLSTQPVYPKESDGIFTRLSMLLEERHEAYESRRRSRLTQERGRI
jgi:polysaccharide biosynthesis protein PelG